MIPLKSNPLNAWIQIIEHLLRLIKLVITVENGFNMLHLSRRSYSTQHKKETHNEKTIMNATTTRGNETNDVVNMNNVKLVIVDDKGFMALPFNTTKGDTTMKKLEKTEDLDEQRRAYVNQTWWINHVDCRHGEKIG